MRECDCVKRAAVIWGFVSGWIRYPATPWGNANKQHQGKDGSSLQVFKQLAEKAGHEVVKA